MGFICENKPQRAFTGVLVVLFEMLILAQGSTWGSPAMVDGDMARHELTYCNIYNFIEPHRRKLPPYPS